MQIGALIANRQSNELVSRAPQESISFETNFLPLMFDPGKWG